ncbi:MAG TPA: amino acid adenylation domain-containing protein [Thermoanaerobaculia bacterium]|jgi:amino acid adenylation domain-containing protein|nr:amino acid adenylation domain-containing protein [Thermoanaerobaculia bacterium]
MSQRPFDPGQEPANLVEVLRRRALHQPDRRAYTFLLDGEAREVHLTYGELDLQARAIAARLQALDAAGERVLLLYPPGLPYAAAFFGCLYAGVAAVPVYPPRPNRPDPRVRSILTDARARVVLTTSAILPAAERPLGGEPGIQWLATDGLDFEAAADWREPVLSPGDLAFLQYTSGSTAAPKGVMVSHGNLVHNERLIERAFGVTADSVVVGWLPLYHDMGLIGNLLQPLWAGCPCVLMSPVDFLQRPRRWLAALSRYGGTVSGGPNFAYDLCARRVTGADLEGLDLSRWQVAFNGAEPVRAETLDRFAAAFAPCGFRREALYPCYGLAEATLFVSGGAVGEPPVVGGFRTADLARHQVAEAAAGEVRRLVASGRPQPGGDGHEVAIVDPETLRRRAPGEVGEIWLRGPSVAGGYWSRPELTKDAFQARTAEGEEPFLRTGDLGFLHGGDLYVAGRLKDLVIIRGRNHYPQDIELTVEKSHPALRPGCGAAFAVERGGEERLVVVQEVRRDARDADFTEVLEAIRRAVSEEHEVQLLAAVLIRTASLAKTSSGKVRRQACRDAYLHDELAVVAAWEQEATGTLTLEALPSDVTTQEGARAWLAAELAFRVGSAPSAVDVDQPLSRCGLDSLHAMELAHAVEERLGLAVPMETFFAGETISSLVERAFAAHRSQKDVGAGLGPAQEGEEEAEHPLSHGQRALWFLHQLDPASAAYNVPAAVTIEGELDTAALRRAFQALADRHATLRSSFAAPLGEPVQRVQPRVEISFVEENASRWGAETLAERLAGEAERPFDLATGPLLRVHLFARSKQEHVLLVVMHHIVTDFWSQAVLFGELGELYQAELAGEPAALVEPALRYSDFVRWQKEMLAGEQGARLRAYWRQRLTGELPVLDLPTDRPRPPVQSFVGATQRVRLTPALAGRLAAAGRERQATPFMTLLAAFQVLLYRYTGQADLAVGVPMAGRGRASLAGVAGYFVNPVVVRSSLQDNPSFERLLVQVRESALEAFEHQDYPFPLLVEELQPERDPSRSPLFQAMFVLQRAPRLKGQDLTPFALNEPETRIVVGGLPVVSTPLPESFAQFDLTLTMGEVEDGLVAAFNYNTDLFDEATVARVAHHFETLLAGIAALPESPLADLPLLTHAERHRLLVKWNHTRAYYPGEALVHDLFERQVDQTPDATSVVHHQQELAYGELDARANRLAHHLQRLGLEPEDRVAIFLERSHVLVEAILGSLKAGACYVPLDPEYPRDRLAFMLADSRARLVLTEERLQPLVPDGVPALCLDALAEIAAESGARPSRRGLPEGAACVVYTSGSTGQPKGVALTHRGIVNLIVSFIRSYSPGPEDRMLPLTSVASASFVGEMFPILCADGALVLPDREEILDTTRLLELVVRANVSILSTVPSLIATLNAMKDELPRLRLILCGGEALTAGDVDRILESATIVNGYGLTETTVCSTIHTVSIADVQSGGTLPIGRPLMNHRLYILDPELNLMPIGCVGKLYIAGDGLARGYLGNPALTADRFVPDPFGRGERMYRTGDLAAWLPDGNIVYRGRSDQQVKVRGYRIELGEIETVLAAHSGVSQAAVVPRQEESGERRLVAYVVAAPGEPPAIGELQAWLRDRLPEYMVPAAFVFLPALPLSPNGKVDAKALPAPERVRPELAAAFAAPKSELERIIAAVWQEALVVEKVGIHDNFFDLGGHSLLLAKVHARLREVLERDLSLVDLFKNPTVASLAEALSRPAPRSQSARETIRRPAAGAPRRQESVGRSYDEIAVVGMSGRFPGARSVEELWENLRAGREAIRFFSDQELLESGVDPELVANPDYVKAKGVLGDVDLFDAGLFGLSPREVELMDPQHRLFLECCWEALERAGYNSGKPLSRVGVFGGESMNTYLITNLLSHLELVASADTLQASLGNDKDPLTSRVSYKLNLKGPSITIQSASSTSLVAVHVACQSLLNRDCEMALAGGVSIHLPELSGYMFHDGGTTSPDGHCRAFDARAKGFVSGHGAGIVALKRLADALRDGDHIHAVIKGSACNNDGSLKVSYTAPSVDGQVEVYSTAYENAGVTPDTLTYLECHGTATPMGDPIEIAALTQAFRAHTDRRNFCAIGSLKTNIGHLDSAAGVCGLIKTVLALEHKQIPPSLHFERPNPQIDFADSPFFVNAALRDWRTEGGLPRRAGVTSLGMGGTNAHVILEEAPALEPSGPSRPWKLLLLSAHAATALEEATSRLADFLDRAPLVDLADVAYTLQVGRRPFAHRRALLTSGLEDAARALATRDPERLLTTNPEPGDRPIVFLFTGQGSQYPNMGHGLYEAEPTYRAEVDRCCELLRPHLGFDLRELLFPPAEREDEAAERLRQTEVAQPALFVVEYALATLWMQWGVRPQAMIGHSLGEYVAACLAGVFSLRDALALVAVRGRLMQALPPGAMLAVPLPEPQVLPLLSDGLSLAAVNRPSLCVVSGPSSAVDRLRAELAERGVEGRPLHTSHAFHSAMMDPILKPFGEWMAGVRLSPPRLPYLSNLTGTWIRPEEATDPAYWAEHIRCPVRFADGIAELLKEPDRVLLEVGPGNALTTLARQHPARTPRHTVLPSLRHPREREDDLAFILGSVARLWLAGADVDWSGFHAHERRRRLPLPTYPFQRQRYWVEPRRDSRERATGKRRRDLASWLYAPVWKQAPPAFAIEEDTRPCLIFLDDCGLGEEVARALEQRGRTVLKVSPGQVFARTGERSFTVDAWSAAGYEALLEELERLGSRPGAVIHLWNVVPAGGLAAGSRLDDLDHTLELGFYSLTFLAQALGKTSVTETVRILAVTSGVHAVTGEEELRPEGALVLGPCRVIPREYPNVACRSLDVLLPRTNGDSLIRLAGRVAAELDLGWEGGAAVALRGSYRWVQEFAPASLPEPSEPSPRLRQSGVYLITGGLGGLGLEVASLLARTAAARLVLVSRNPLPDREDWDGWLAAHDDTNPVSRRLRRVRELEAAGAEVMLAAADVADPAALRTVVEEALNRFGAIHGVVHAAGRPGGGVIQVKTWTAAEDVLAPKVRGALALDEVFRGLPLDFLVLFSSVTAVLAQPGQVDYVAANAFLDAFACQRSGRGEPTVSIGWDAWREVGMAVETQVPAELREWRRQELKTGLTNAEGVEVFRRVLAMPVPWLVVSTLDLTARLEQSQGIHALAEIEKAQAARAAHPRPLLANAYVAPRGEAEKRIAGVWEELLGIERIGVHDNFFDLGGNSLMAIRVISRLKAELGIDVSEVSIFEGPTVASLAKILAPADDEKVADFVDGRSRGERRRAARRSRHAAAEVS